MSRIFLKLALSISLLILVIEGSLLYFSLNTKNRELNMLKNREFSIYSQNKIYTDSSISTIKEKFKTDIIQLTILIIFFVVLGFSAIYYCFVGRYLSQITSLNESLSNFSQSKSVSIPNDEIGELISSRQSMLKQLKFQITENKKLVRILIHDLNNSLSLIFGSLYLLEKKGENIDFNFLNQKLIKIKAGANAQKNLINSIRNIFILKSENIKIEKVYFEEIISEIQLMFGDRFKEKSIQFNYIHDQENFYLNINKVLFVNNVINNLISNSIKFLNKNGKITIQTSIIGDQKVISFKDNGIGIPKHICEVLFDYDSKTTRLGTNGEKGTGFGLPLVKENIVSLGGTIEVQSVAREDSLDLQGTTFLIKLPN